MWTAVRQRFKLFHADLMLLQDEIDDGLTKASGVSKSIRRAYYGDSNIDSIGLIVGSWGKRTQVRPSDDVDLMVTLPNATFSRIIQRLGNVQSALLQEVKENLLITYPNSVMRADGQVIQVKFNSIMVEVVPVFRSTANQFYMPDTNNGGNWKIVDPNAELSAIQLIDQSSNGNLRAICQMIKHWKSENNVPLKSFQIELLIIEYLKSRSYPSFDYYWYDWYIRDFFYFLSSKLNGFLLVPGTNEVVWLGNEWRSHAERAYEVAKVACVYEHGDYEIMAGNEWQKIFGNRILTNVF
jgi:Second Messenger Oligonucleotide or Dinucleotide Synthetase domain